MDLNEMLTLMFKEPPFGEYELTSHLDVHIKLSLFFIYIESMINVLILIFDSKIYMKNNFLSYIKY